MTHKVCSTTPKYIAAVIRDFQSLTFVPKVNNCPENYQWRTRYRAELNDKHYQELLLRTKSLYIQLQPGAEIGGRNAEFWWEIRTREESDGRDDQKGNG